MTNIALVVIVLILLIPSWRLAFQKSILGWTMSAPKVEKLDEGITVPENWEFYTLEGKRVSFSDFKNDKVFVNFWASWCAPCLAEMPSLMERNKELQNEVTFLFMTDDQLKKVEAVVSEYSDFRNDFFQYKSLPSSLHHTGIPYSVWVNKGIITAHFSGSASWSNEDIINGFN